MLVRSSLCVTDSTGMVLEDFLRSGLGGMRKLLGENGGNLAPKFGYLLAPNLPDNRQAQLEVLVGNAIAERGNSPPGNFRVPGLQIRRQGGDLFADHDELKE